LNSDQTTGGLKSNVSSARNASGIGNRSTVQSWKISLLIQ
jgi:hypothetical protein